MADARTEHLITLVKEGAALAAAARLHGVDGERVREILKQQTISATELREAAENPPRRDLQVPPVLAPAIEAMWREGMLYHEIAEVLGVSCGAVHRLIRQRVPASEPAPIDDERSSAERLLDGMRGAASVLGERLPAAGARSATAELSLLLQRLESLLLWIHHEAPAPTDPTALQNEAEALESAAESLRALAARSEKLATRRRGTGIPRPEEGADPAPGTPIDSVNLSAGAVERLRRAGVETLEQIPDLPEGELSRQGLWMGDVRQIIAVLARTGLSLRSGRGGTRVSGALEPGGRHSARDADIISARDRGDTLQEIGARFGLSRERVRQILANTGALDSKASKRARAQRQLAAADVQRDEVLAAWRAGSEPAAIATRLGLTRACVSSLIEAHATAADRAARRVAHSTGARRAGPRGHSDEMLIESLKQVVSELGRVPFGKEYGEIAKAQGLPSLATVENRFGGWNPAVRAAGLTPRLEARRPYRRRWTEETCLEVMRGLAAELGELPSLREYEELSTGRPDLPCAATVRKRIGSWSRLALLLEGDAGSSVAARDR